MDLENSRDDGNSAQRIPLGCGEPELRGLYVCEDMHQRTDHGAVGYPERASAEKGKRLIQAAVDRTVEVVQALLKRPLPR